MGEVMITARTITGLWKIRMPTPNKNSIRLHFYWFLKRVNLIALLALCESIHKDLIRRKNRILLMRKHAE